MFARRCRCFRRYRAGTIRCIKYFMEDNNGDCEIHQAAIEAFLAARRRRYTKNGVKSANRNAVGRFSAPFLQGLEHGDSTAPISLRMSDIATFKGVKDEEISHPSIGNVKTGEHLPRGIAAEKATFASAANYFSLRGSLWINDEVINSYISFLTKHSKETNVHCFNSFFSVLAW